MELSVHACNGGARSSLTAARNKTSALTRGVVSRATVSVRYEEKAKANVRSSCTLRGQGISTIPRETRLARRGSNITCASAAVDVSNDEVDASQDGEECEVVNGFEVSLGEGAGEEGKFGGYLVQPLKNSNGTGVLLLPDILGHRSMEIREFAHRLACFGYSVFVSDLFRGQPWDNARPKEEYDAWRAKHAGPAERVEQDIDTAASFLQVHLAQAHAAAEEPHKMAVIGFCFGGGRVLEALAKDGGRASPKFVTGVSFYGTRFDADAVSPLIRVPVLFITGDKDPLCPVESCTAVAERVPGSEVQVYKGMGHAFVHRPSSMDEDEESERAFQAARSWLHRHLLPLEEFPDAA